MRHRSPAGTPTILLGAFDRHNFGDLLFPHVVARMLAGADLRYGGLVNRDLRCYGGHEVTALVELAESLRGWTSNVLHVGGELLTCNAWEAAVMLSPADRVEAAIASESEWKRDAPAWALARLGADACVPYVFSRQAFPGLNANQVFFNAVGGVDLDAHPFAFRAEVLRALQAADDISVRDRQTQALLKQAGIGARLVPDPVVMVADLFGNRVRRRAFGGEVKEALKAFPGGYAAVQFSADFEDDETLDTIARQLDSMAATSRLGVMLFRAGAAPWHDDLACCERIAARMRHAPVKIFGSLNVWDICALISQSRLYCGSSLHGRIVAMAFAVPRVNVRHPARAGQITKQTAYAATWERPEGAAIAEIDEIAAASDRALASSRFALAATARELADRYREAFAPVRMRLS